MASKLITESDVKKRAVDDPLVVDLDTVITPSALDTAYARGIRVVFVRDLRSGILRSTMTPFQALPSPPIRSEPSEAPSVGPASGKSCGCACSCGTQPRSDPGGAQRLERDWVDILHDSRRKGLDPTAFRA